MSTAAFRPAPASSATPAHGPAGPRRGWPRAGPGQKTLLAGAVMIILGSFLPWVSTPVGNLSGMAGPGLWTLAAGSLGLAGVFLRHRSLAMAHAAAAGGCAVALTVWQVARLAQISAGTGSWGAAVPSTGLLLVFGGGVLALRALWRLHTRQ